MIEHYRVHLEDVRRIVAVCAARGVILDPMRAYAVWNSHSDDYCAGWLFLPDEDEELFNTVMEGLRRLAEAEL